jgi:curved DNA-binding protein CbpA
MATIKNIVKSIDKLNYYEILKIPLNASFIEIKQAYSYVLSLYDEDSFATYSLFSHDERDTILKVIEKAFVTLIDEDKRADYDKMLVESGQVDIAVFSKDQEWVKEINNKEEKMPESSFKHNGKDIILSSDGDQVPDVPSTVTSAYRQDIIQTIDQYKEKIENQKMDRKRIINRLKLLQMRKNVYENENLAEVEHELLEMSVDIEAPSLRMQRSISIVVFFYTLLALIGFVALAITDAIILPGFNIPYSVLLMGLVGCLVSMYVKLPNIRIRQPLSYDPTVWFIISPIVAVIMAGIFFGIAQIFIPADQIDLSDESWIFWIIAWIVGLINWVYFYERLSNGVKGSVLTRREVKTENIKVVNTDIP